MHVELRKGETDELIGRVNLVEGKAVGDAKMGNLDGFVAFGDNYENLTTADGEKFLRAFPNHFRSGYIYAVVIEDEEELMATLEEEYTQDRLDAIEDIKALSKAKGKMYNPTYWQRAVKDKGGVRAAKDLLASGGTSGSDGGGRLHELGLDYLSVEWSVLNPKWTSLFAEAERQGAYEEMTRLMADSGKRA